MKRNKKLERHYFKAISDRLDQDRDERVHLSDLEGCIQKSLLRRTVRPHPPLSDQGLIRITRGICVEDFMTRNRDGLYVNGCPIEPIVKDDIICTIDDEHPEHGIVEIKATIKSKKNFRPLTTYPWWVTRCKGYAYARGVNHINLCVMHTSWYRGTEEDINCYDITFSDAELDENWNGQEGVLVRAEIFRHAMKTNTRIPSDWVRPHKFGGNRNECGGCEWKSQCYWVMEGHAYARGIQV